jgi:hypothetical protein
VYHGFEIHGNIKYGSTLGKLAKTTCSDFKNFKRYVCILCVSSHKHTNALLLNVPNRQDLASNSCVSYDAKMFNGKLGRLRKVHKNLSLLTVDLYRNLYTRYLFHLNAKGKEHTANRVISGVWDLSHINKHYQ